MEDFILELSSQCRIIVTSRPEGMDRAKLTGHGFTIMRLKELSQEQQMQMIDARLDPSSPSRDFFVQLFQFISERAGMDHIFAERFPLRLIEEEPEVNTHQIQLGWGKTPVISQEELYEIAIAAQPLFEKALHEIAGELGIPVFKAPLSEEQENNLPPCCLIIAPLKGNGVPNERVAEKTKDYEKDILKQKQV